MSSDMIASKERGRAPKAVSLTCLETALAPFYDSFWATGLVISSLTKIITAIVDESVNLASCDETYQAQCWQEMLRELRDTRSKTFKDPESLRVAQKLAHLKPIEVIQELASKCRYMNGPVWQQWEKKGDFYSTVYRCYKWLYDCARRCTIPPAEKNHFLQTLGFLGASQPLYTCPELQYLYPEDPKIFGKDGVITPALKRLSMKTSDDTGILYITEIVLRQAMNVADVWKQIDGQRRSSTADFEYTQYISSLLKARESFIEHFSQPSFLIDGRQTSFEMREAIKNIPFVELWNALWKQSKLCAAKGRHKSLRNWVLRSLHAESKRLGVDTQYLINAPHAKDFSVQADFTAARHGVQLSRIELAWGSQWGRFLYPSESVAAAEASMVEESRHQAAGDDENVIVEEVMQYTYDLSHLEAQGPCIDASNYSDAVCAPPTEQDCGICAEGYTDNCADGSQPMGQCVQLSACGHYFHHVCISTWMNSILANSNLCP
jgi:hypothetical protein